MKPLMKGDLSSKVYQVSELTGTQTRTTTGSQQPATGQILRILTGKAAPGKLEQALKVEGEEVPKLFAGAKGIQWYKRYNDPSTGELGNITLWDSQANLDAFMKSDARKAVVEKMRPLTQGDPSIKVYQVEEPKR